MAIQIFSRNIPKTLPLSSFISRSLSTASSSSALLSRSPHSFLHRLRPLAVVPADFRRLLSSPSLRAFSTRATASSLNDPNPNWSNRPPKETILLDGCDFEHWLVVMEKPEGEPTRDEIIDSYIKTLAQVVGSEEEARMKIYSVSTRHYFAFGALVSEELSYKIKELPKVRWVLPDSYLDVKNKDYGGEPFINGQAVPYDPKYHEEWVRNNARANERNRRNDRPRNADRSRNFDRRENVANSNVQNRPPMSYQTVQNPGTNMGGAPPSNMGGFPPSNMGGAPPSNMGGAPPSNMGRFPPSNMGGAPPSNMGRFPPSNMGGFPPNNAGGFPPNNAGGFPSNNAGGFPVGNAGSFPSNNAGGYPPNHMGGVPSNSGYGGMPPNSAMGGNGMTPNNMGGMPPNQNREWSSNFPGKDYQPNYTPSRDVGGTAGGNPYSSS
ncbi:multiple organellar RNA editing factor 8, chloroplastic/mitochondrial [Senna tora]|uniref:Multiple organellar RNA editing factor 8, chloroplastic/mitochondrial n=1 Tax=Senna tora TaxID=362788 RepID=A0A834X1F2_9FABA|nr:multiple organellar RNA editing factor 8, chloroplastic/mitochondrial [Senna tora]